MAIEVTESAIASARIIPAFVLLLTAIFAGVWVGIVTSLTVSYVWYVQKSAFAGRVLHKFIKLLGNDVFFVLSGVLVLSPLGTQGAYASLAAGLITFLTHRFGALLLIFDRLLLYDRAPELNARALLMVIRREWMNAGLYDAEVRTMEQNVIQALKKNPFQKKS
jgi:hypothetical protein